MTSRRLLIVGLLAGLGLSIAATARAEHNAAPPAFSARELYDEHGTRLDMPGTEDSLEITLKLGRDGFHLGSRVFGPQGYTGGAWLNGLLRPDGFRLDGRLEHDGTHHDFRFDADVDDWWRRILRWKDGALDL